MYLRRDRLVGFMPEQHQSPKPVSLCGHPSQLSACPSTDANSTVCLSALFSGFGNVNRKVEKYLYANRM